MTCVEWLQMARTAAPELKELLAHYHPVSRRVPLPIGPITAPCAEQACERVREQIRHNFEGDPVMLFEEALQGEDIERIMCLLNDAWFGVPETTACWKIRGFKEAVDLMDDPPEEESVTKFSEGVA